MFTTVAIALGLASTVSALPLTSNPALTSRATSVLFPVSNASSSSWSVSKHISGSKAVPFSDATFRPTNEIKGLTHDVVKAPDGVPSIQSKYPKGSFKPSATPRGGISFYAPGPEDVDLTTAAEATLSYSVLFEDGFDFVKGGKLPGLCEQRFHVVNLR